MEGKHYFWIIITLIIGGILYFVFRIVFPSEKEKIVEVDCGSKKAYRFTDPEAMYPTFVKDYSASVKLTTDLLGSLAENSSNGGEVGINMKNEARELREKLSQDNSIFQDQLKGAFMQANLYPCDDTIQSWYRNMLNEMTTRVMDLKQFIAASTKEAGTNGTHEDSNNVQIIVDTTNKRVYTSEDNVSSEQLVVKKDTTSLKPAFRTLNKSILTKKSSQFRTVVNPKEP